MNSSPSSHSVASRHFLRGTSLLFSLLLLTGLPGRAQDDPQTDAARQNLNLITEDWASLQKSFKESDMLDSSIGNFERRLESSGSSITALPDSNPKKAEMLAALKKIQADFPVQSQAAQGALEAKHLTEYWERDSKDGDGWEQETAATFSAMLKQQSEAMSRLGMPKTAQRHRDAVRFLKDSMPKPEAPAVKNLLGGIEKMRDATRAKLVAAAGAILDEAGKMKLTQDSRDRLNNFSESDLPGVLGDAPETAALQARAAKLVGTFDKAAGGTRAEVEKLSSDLNEQSAKAWPKLAESVKTPAEFDAAAALKDSGGVKGKMFLLSAVPNRMGWDFKPGDYDFALHKNGTAVVGTYDPAVRKVVEETKKRLQLTDLPEEDYDLIAEVTGTAKATVFKGVEGEIKVDGTSDTLKVSGRREVTEDAVLLHIIGLHVGPVAVVAGAGAVQADGTIAEVAAPSGAVSASGGGMLERIFWFVLALVAGFLALAQAGLPALTRLGPVKSLQPSLTPGVMTGAGLAFIAAGLVLMIRGLFIHGLLMSLAFILTGVFLSLSFFTVRKWMPEHLAAKVRPKGTLIGLAVVAIAVLSLILAGRFVVI